MAGIELARFTPYLLNQAAEQQSKAFSKLYKDRYGMLRTQWRVLFHLGRHGEMSAHDIVRHAGIHKTKVSRAVRALEERRWIARQTSPHDRRVELLSLRPAGREVFDDLAREASAFERRLTRQLGRERAALLRQLLSELAALPDPS